MGRVFAIGATGILDCLDATTGQKIWSRDVLGENKLENLIWGVSASPLVFDDTVVVTGGLTKGPSLFAYRKSTGEPLWHAGTDKASYSSPILATLAGRRVILVVNAASLTAHDPATGAELLNYPWPGDWPKAAQPVVIDDHRVFISAGYGLGCTLLDIQTAPEGKLTATQVWKTMRMKTQFNSPALRDGFIYGLDDGLLACVDVATGERKWKDGHFGSGQTLLADDLILVQSETGPVILAEAHPDGYKELGQLPALNAKTWNHPTLARPVPPRPQQRRNGLLRIAGYEPCRNSITWWDTLKERQGLANSFQDVDMRLSGASGFKPVQIWKTRKIVIRGRDAAIVFDRQRCQMRIGDEIAGRPCATQHTRKDASMLLGRDGGADDRQIQPLFDITKRFIKRQWLGHHTRICGEADECTQYCPRQCNRFRAGERLIKPGARRIMPLRVAKDRIDQQICVDENHALTEVLGQLAEFVRVDSLVHPTRMRAQAIGLRRVRMPLEARSEKADQLLLLGGRKFLRGAFDLGQCTHTREL